MHVSPDLHELLQIPEQGRALQVLLNVLQIAAMLIAARSFGWLAERIKVPSVVGELIAGAVIGPYLLGSRLLLPIHGTWVPLFPAPSGGQWPVNDIVWTLAQIASIVLLFITGLHTDLKQFLRYVGPATLVALAGVALPFALGAGVVYLPPFSSIASASGMPLLIPALFMGAILAATSIGITARVLADIDKLDSPEGVTILGAAVVDDVLGIIALAIVGGIASAVAVGATSSASIPTGQILAIAGKAFGVWIGLTVLALAISPLADRWIAKARGTAVALALAVAFIGSGIAEFFGLAFIIGAYSVGLGLSRTKAAGRLLEELQPVADFLVPLFFATLGMLADFHAMFADKRVVIFGLVVTLAAIIGKVIGCGTAAIPGGFNLRGAWRIGIGMMPRGEVALIVAGIGLSRGLIDRNLFGVSILMTLLTTVIAPILLVPAFAQGGSGRRRPEQRAERLPSPSRLPGLVVSVPADLLEPFVERLVQVAESHGWDVAYEREEEEIRLLRSGDDAAQFRLQGDSLRIDASDTRQNEFARFVEDARKSIIADLGNPQSGTGFQPVSRNAS